MTAINGPSGLGVFWHHLGMPEREVWLDALGNNAVTFRCTHLCVCLAIKRKNEELCIIITETIVLMIFKSRFRKLLLRAHSHGCYDH